MLVSAVMEAVAPGATEPAFSIWFEVVAFLFSNEDVEAEVGRGSLIDRDARDMAGWATFCLA